MSDEQTTLREFFLYTEQEVPEERRTAVESHPDMEALKKSIAEECKGLPWSFTATDVTKKIKDLLDIDVAGIMVGAWSKYREVLKYADSKQYPPTDTYLVSLAEHTVSSTHHPYIDVTVNEKPVGRIEFEVKITLTLKGIILTIKGGRIMSIKTGSCKGKGTITYKGVPVFERQTDSFTLPGTIELGQGIPIPGRGGKTGRGPRPPSATRR